MRNELKAYEAFQKAVFEGAEEAARLDAMPEPAFIPYGRCSRHPSVSTFEHGFDVPCYKCEGEMEMEGFNDPHPDFDGEAEFSNYQE